MLKGNLQEALGQVASGIFKRVYLSQVFSNVSQQFVFFSENDFFLTLGVRRILLIQNPTDLGLVFATLNESPVTVGS